MSFLTDLLASQVVNSGLVVSASGGLLVSVSAGSAAIAYMVNVLASAATVSVPASSTSRLDWNGTSFEVVAATSPINLGWIPLAQIVTSASAVTGVTDMRPLGQFVQPGLSVLEGPLMLPRSNDLIPSGLPAASATYRGQILRTETGSGVADTLWLCAKNADNSYSWHQLD